MTPEQLATLRKYRISIPSDMECEEFAAGDLFNYLEKNNGLTEEYIYNNENPSELQLPVYTASYEPIGALPINFIKDGRPLKVCAGEVIIIFRQGYAGEMYIPKDTMFYASEHTIPIQVKPEHAKKLNQHWFIQYYQPEVMHFVTGKADSGNFSELAFSKLNFLIPSREWQDECALLYTELNTELKKIGENISGLRIEMPEKKGLSDEELVAKYEAGEVSMKRMVQTMVATNPAEVSKKKSKKK